MRKYMNISVQVNNYSRTQIYQIHGFIESNVNLTLSLVIGSCNYYVFI